MTKQELIAALSPELLRTGHSPRDVQSVLETYSVPELQELFRKQQGNLGKTQKEELERQVEAIREEVREKMANDPERIRRRQEDERQGQEIYLDYYLTQIFLNAVPGHGYPVRNRASEQIILGWLNPGETLSGDFLVKIIGENPSLASHLQWRSVNPKQAEARQQELDKQTFVDAAKALRSFGVNEANLNAIRSVLGSGFNVYAIQQALASNALQLSGPSQSELDQWAEEDIEAHNQRLLQADPTTLRLLARQESADKRVQEQAQRVNEQFEATKQRDEAIGYPQLPSEITKDQIRNAPTDKLKLWIKKYGNANVTARLQGRG